MWGGAVAPHEHAITPHTFFVKYTLGIQYGAIGRTPVGSPRSGPTRTCPTGRRHVGRSPVMAVRGPSRRKTHTWAMPSDGYLVGLGGHLHDGGFAIVTKHEDGT